MAASPHLAPARLMVVPGLNDSPPEHWQSWLQSLYRHSLRVIQHDWTDPDIERWAGRIGSTLGRAGPGPWIAVAHSFGALALARHLAHEPQSPVRAALLVAPADPDRFGIAGLLPQSRLPVPNAMVLSTSDPWLSLNAGLHWAGLWGSSCIHLGDAGHINVESGFHTLLIARRWVAAMGHRLEHERRLTRASIDEWAFAV